MPLAPPSDSLVVRFWTLLSKNTEEAGGAWLWVVVVARTAGKKGMEKCHET